MERYAAKTKVCERYIRGIRQHIKQRAIEKTHSSTFRVYICANTIGTHRMHRNSLEDEMMNAREVPPYDTFCPSRRMRALLDEE